MVESIHLNIPVIIYSFQQIIQLFNLYARVVELADALDLGSSSGNRMGVQISPFAPTHNFQYVSDMYREWVQFAFLPPPLRWRHKEIADCDCSQYIHFNPLLIAFLRCHGNEIRYYKNRKSIQF